MNDRLQCTRCGSSDVSYVEVDKWWSSQCLHCARVWSSEDTRPHRPEGLRVVTVRTTISPPPGTNTVIVGLHPRLFYPGRPSIFSVEGMFEADFEAALLLADKSFRILPDE